MKNITKESTPILLSDKELYRIAEWGLKNGYEDSACWDKTSNIDEAISCVLSDFNSFLDIPYPEGLKDIPQPPILYRIIRLAHKHELNINKLNYRWAYLSYKGGVIRTKKK